MHSIAYLRINNIIYSYYKPIRPVLDVSLLGIYLLFFGQTTIKKLVTLGSCLDFLCVWEI